MTNLLPLTVENAKKNREALLALLSGAKDVTLDVSAFDAVDLSGLQTLVAFAREASARGKKLSFSGTVGESLAKALEVSGLAPSGCSSADDVGAAIQAACR